MSLQVLIGLRLHFYCVTEKEKENIKTEKKKKEESVDYMHSSCIVVRLDWAAGLPAGLIRRFGSPDLTRKTLFSSQKHQSHSS